MEGGTAKRPSSVKAIGLHPTQNVRRRCIYIEFNDSWRHYLQEIRDLDFLIAHANHCCKSTRRHQAGNTIAITLREAIGKRGDIGFEAEVGFARHFMAIKQQQ